MASEYKEITAYATEHEATAYAVLAIVAGLTLCFLGRKLLKVLLFTVGVIMFSAMIYYLILTLQNHNLALGLSHGGFVAVVVISGVVGGLILLWILQLGIFLVGGFLGICISLIISILIGNNYGAHSEVVKPIVTGILFFVGGFITLAFQNLLIIVASGISGSFVFFMGIDQFAKTGMVSGFVYLFQNEDIPKSNGGGLYGMMAGCVVLSFVGIVAQLHTPKKRKEGSAGWDDDEESQSLLSPGRINY
eukprot:TRINITY_DN255_c0_g1_i1.p1 TRINITY_DN255_c0_g1~~TRINITY_DN255_c0_g1_i1.p1  ORF type:complete len:248 (-),score=69.49 TRINITY_DN255_c0_g1_i1:95-838(-)